MNENRYLLEEVARISGVEVRTIQHWVSRGLLEGAGRQGPGTRYPESWLHRVMFIQRLREMGVPLDLIGQTMSSLDEAQIQRVASGKEPVRLLPLSSPASVSTRYKYEGTVVREGQLSEDSQPRSRALRYEQESVAIMEDLRRLLLSRRKDAANTRWVTGQATEDLLLLVRGLDANQERELEKLARRLGEILTRQRRDGA